MGHKQLYLKLSCSKKLSFENVRKKEKKRNQSKTVMLTKNSLAVLKFSIVHTDVHLCLIAAKNRNL